MTQKQVKLRVADMLDSGSVTCLGAEVQLCSAPASVLAGRHNGKLPFIDEETVELCRLFSKQFSLRADEAIAESETVDPRKVRSTRSRLACAALHLAQRPSLTW